MKKITTALQFSGGKDSLTILHLWRHKLDETMVVWVNTGASYPSVIEQMKGIKNTVPNFLEVKTDQPAQIEANGYPTDLVPLHFTVQGRAVRETDQLYRIQDTFSCCSANIWQPMYQATKQLGVSVVLRGQRDSEKYKNPIRSGYVEAGITYIYPIQEWSEADVFAYLRKNNIPIPEYYAYEMHSRDCWNCTGYLDEAAGRIASLPPGQREEVIHRLHYINAAIESQAQPLKQILGE
mgnify:CR=1 FL=1